MDYSSAFSFESINKYKPSFELKKSKGGVMPDRSKYTTLINVESDEPEQRGKKNDVNYVVTYFLTAIGFLLVMLTAPFSLLFAVKSIGDQERGIHFRLGRFWDVRGPGITFVIPLMDKLNKIDLRVKAFHVPPMLVMLQDGGSVSLGATIMYSIQDAVVATLSLQNINHTIRTLAQSVMYQVVSLYSMEKLRRNKKNPNAFIKKELQEEIMQWGLSIHNVELSQITELTPPPTAVQNVQEQLGPIFGQLGGLEGLISTAADFYLPQSDGIEETEIEVSRSLIQTFKDKIEKLLDYSMTETIGKKFMFHLFPGSTISDNCLDSSRILVLDCKNSPVGVKIYGHDEMSHYERASCDVEVKVGISDLLKLLNGQISKTSLYFQGRVEVNGDTSALELLSQFKDEFQISEL